MSPGLCGELAALGFDEIVLECWAYPSRGNLDVITDGPAGDRQAVTDLALALLEQIDAETEGYDVRISLVADGELLERTGLDLNSLDQWEGNIWTVGEGEYLAGLDKNADGGRIVRIRICAGRERSGSAGCAPGAGTGINRSRWLRYAAGGCFPFRGGAENAGIKMTEL